MGETDATELSLRAQVMEEHDQTLQQLKSIWDELGLSSDQQDERRKVFQKHLLDLCKKILNDEEALKSRIDSRISSNKQKILKLFEDLSIEESIESDGLTLLDLDSLLQEKIDKLEQMMEERIEQLKELQEKDEGLCELLCETPYYIKTDSIPSIEDIVNVEQHIKAMEKEKEEREKTFATLKAGVLQFLEELEQSPDDSFLQKLVCADDDEDEVPLGKSVIQQLRTVHSDLEFKVLEYKAKSLELRETIRNLYDLLQIPVPEQEAFLTTAPRHTPSTLDKLKEELRRLKVLRQQNISLFIERLQEDLNVVWEKCFVGEEEREAFTSTHIGADEEVLEAYEKEVERWKKFSTENQSLLELISHFLNLFVQMCELEDKAKDPSRLFNTRGGALLQEEKAKKKVKNELPRVELRLHEIAKEWAKQNNGEPFRIYGNPIEDHISSLWENHEARKEQEKCKKKANPDSRQHSTKKMVTPAAIPSSTPRKRGLVNDDVMSAKRAKPNASNPVSYISSTKPGYEISTEKNMMTPRARPLKERNAIVPSVMITKPGGETCRPTDELHESTITYDKFKDKLKSSSEFLNSTILDQTVSDSGKY